MTDTPKDTMSRYQVSCRKSLRDEIEKAQLDAGIEHNGQWLEYMLQAVQNPKTNTVPDPEHVRKIEIQNLTIISLKQDIVDLNDMIREQKEKLDQQPDPPEPDPMDLKLTLHPIHQALIEIYKEETGKDPQEFILQLFVEVAAKGSKQNYMKAMNRDDFDELWDQYFPEEEE